MCPGLRGTGRDSQWLNSVNRNLWNISVQYTSKDMPDNDVVSLTELIWRDLLIQIIYKIIFTYVLVWEVQAETASDWIQSMEFVIH